MARQKPTGKDGAVTTMICVTCGNQQFFTGVVPLAMVCPTCRGTVFREFDTPAADDQAAESAAQEQARSLGYGDSSPDSDPGDVLDLDNSA